LSIHPEVEKAGLVFSQKKKNELNFYIKTIAVITNSLDKTSSSSLSPCTLCQLLAGAGCALWGGAGGESLPSTRADHALGSALRVSGGCVYQCWKLVGVVSKYFNNHLFAFQWIRQRF